MKKRLPKLVILLGPTASGKSDLAIKLAKKFNGEIINADSRSIYKGMSIGTASPFAPIIEAKPRGTLQVRRKVGPKEGGLASIKIKKFLDFRFQVSGIQHHLFHFIDPWEMYSVGQYKQDAIEVINDIISRGKLPILVGGTGLYIWAVVDNLQIPEVLPNLKLRKQLWQEIEPRRTLQRSVAAESERRRFDLEKIRRDGLDRLWKRLIKLDPEAAKFVQKDNPRRVIRALEVILTINKSLERELGPKRLRRFGLSRQRSGFYTTSIIKFSDLRQKGAPLYNVLQIGIKVSLQRLEKRIDARVDGQIKDGLVEETKKCYSHILQNMRINPHRSSPSFPPKADPPLEERGGSKEGERIWQLPSMTSLGYRQIGMYLRKKEAKLRVAPAAEVSLRHRNLNSLDEAIRILKRDTRRYAARQMTWFRRDKRIKWVSANEAILQTRKFLKNKIY